MPYYIYQVTELPVRQLKQLERHEAYRDAAARVKQLRAERGVAASVSIRMIHADSELHAEDLLNEIRQPQPELGDD